MKRIAVIALALIMVAALFSACSKAAPEGKYVVKSLGGKPVEEALKADLEDFGEGMTLDDLLKTFGIKAAEEYMVMDFKSDGTIAFTVAGEDPDNGTWKQDGSKITVTIDGDSLDMTLNGSEISATFDDQDVVFIKK